LVGLVPIGLEDIVKISRDKKKGTEKKKYRLKMGWFYEYGMRN
jgi:hypothetical protein